MPDRMPPRHAWRAVVRRSGVLLHPLFLVPPLADPFAVTSMLPEAVDRLRRLPDSRYPGRCLYARIH